MTKTLKKKEYYFRIYFSLFLTNGRKREFSILKNEQFFFSEYSYILYSYCKLEKNGAS